MKKTIDIRDMDKERLAVIENIRSSLSRGDSFRKVELHDPVVTDEDVKRVIVPFDTLRKKPLNKIKAVIARIIAERETKRLNVNTEIVGLENALSVKGGAIITCNHFNIIDNTVVRHLAMKCARHRSFHIVVQETNIFMKGFFGFLMKNCNTLPVSKSPSYMAKNLMPALRKILGEGGTVLIYPEQEMWFNYKKPRELREGAYYYAFELSVPIIPCFVELRETSEVGEGGFYKIKHIIHVMPPIYPDTSLDKRTGYQKMRDEDARLKRECYERAYGESPDTDTPFNPERDIAGYRTNKIAKNLD